MKTLNTATLVLSLALFGGLGLSTAASANVAPPVHSYTLVEGGSEHLQQNRVASDGSDHLQQNRVASDGSDHLQQNRTANRADSNAGSKLFVAENRVEFGSRYQRY